MNKRILSILLCLMLVASLLVMAVPASAASDSVDIKVTASKTEAKPGDDVDLTVTMGPIAAVDVLELKVLIPDGLTVKSAEVGAELDAAKDKGSYAVNPSGAISFYTASTPPDPDFNYSSETDTTVAVFHCTVADDASGTLEIKYDENKFWFTSVENKDGLEYSAQGTSITIGGSETTAPTTPETTPETTPDGTSAVEPTKTPATSDQSTKDSSTKDSSTKDSGTAKTGDSTHLYLWLLIMLASMAGVAVVLYTAKKKGIFTK